MEDPNPRPRRLARWIDIGLLVVVVPWAVYGLVSILAGDGAGWTPFIAGLLVIVPTAGRLTLDRERDRPTLRRTVELVMATFLVALAVPGLVTDDLPGVLDAPTWLGIGTLALAGYVAWPHREPTSEPTGRA